MSAMRNPDSPDGRLRVLSALLAEFLAAREGWFPARDRFRVEHYDDIASIDALEKEKSH